MKDILLEVFVVHFADVIALFLVTVVVALIGKLMGVLKTKLTSEQLEHIKKWAKILVESAQRLEESGGLNNTTKKELVMNQLMELVESSKFKFTEAQIDAIRRAAVVSMENLSMQMDVILDDFLSDVQEEADIN
ncbi:putative Holliday junction resolvase-like endonuclease [Clostridiales Family XIII bacterium PM5-7]